MASDNHRGKLEWMRAVLTRYEGPLVRYAARITGDWEQARDVVQDTFLRLCSAKRSRVETHLAQWLFTVCRRRALDVRRKDRRMTALRDGHVESCQSRSAVPSAAMEQGEVVSQVIEVLAALPENQQEVIRLKFQNGFSYREISRITGLSVSNVGFLIHRGLKTIREKLAKSRDCEGADLPFH